ncbi:hypothetical protein PFISCL1PPCAC_11143, partial [Pristionchus fissidentatus]
SQFEDVGIQFLISIFELYRFGPKEHWIRAENLSSDERRDIISGLCSVNTCDFFDSRHIGKFLKV